MRAISIYWNRVYEPLLAKSGSKKIGISGQAPQPFLAGLSRYCQENRGSFYLLPPFKKGEGLFAQGQGSLPQGEALFVFCEDDLPEPFELTDFQALNGLVFIENPGAFIKEWQRASLYLPFHQGLVVMYPAQGFEPAFYDYANQLKLSQPLSHLINEALPQKRPAQTPNEKNSWEEERAYFLKRIENLQNQLQNTNDEVVAVLNSSRFRMGSLIADSLSSPKELMKFPKKLYRFMKKKPETEAQSGQGAAALLPGIIKEEPLPQALYTREELLRINQNNLHGPWQNEQNPLVSLIIVNKDGHDKLKILFESLQKAVFYPNYEVIVVDNGSKDQSLPFLEGQKAHMNLHIIKNRENLSFSKANNQGAEKSRGDYLVFLNNDIEVTDGWLDELLYAGQKANAGAVGAKLVYPQIPKDTINQGKSYLLQHTGIAFREDIFNEKPFLRPYNMDNGQQVFADEKREEPLARLSVTAAVLLVKKTLFLKVQGFDEGYEYGYEDVDLCLKFHRLGYQNRYCPSALLFHYEFGTQNTSTPKAVIKRRTANMTLFQKKWQAYLEKEIISFSVKNLKSEGLHVAFMVTQNNPNTMAGDYFTAMELGTALKAKGCTVSYIEKGRGEDWYDLPPGIDVLVAMVHSYNLEQIKTNYPKYTLAWMRNWFDEWCDNPSIKSYNLLLASSKTAVAYVENRLIQKVQLFPIATNAHTFGQVNTLPSNAFDEGVYGADYLFTGSYWNDQRDIIHFLHPDALPYKGKIYGANWEKVPHLAPLTQGPKAYSEMPTIYQYTKVVIDDANSKTKAFGAVNSRVFDALAAGRLVLTNGTLGAQETFEGKLPTFSSREELEKTLDYYLTHEQERKEKVEELREFVLAHHTYDRRAQELLALLQKQGEKDPAKIAIMICAPNHRDIAQWGDYHFAQSLGEAFKEQGYAYEIRPIPQWQEPFNGKYVLFLRGINAYAPQKEHINILWNISHPDTLTPQECNQYDHVCVASTLWAQQLKEKLQVPVTALMQCTDEKRFYEPYRAEKKADLLFVGNARGVYRKILKDLLPAPYPLQVYGSGWEEFIPNENIAGGYIDNKQLGKAYQGCKILLNDHWQDMRDGGFIANRVFDGLAAGAFILSDEVQGIHELLPGAVATYNGTKKDLHRQIEHYINNPDLRRKMALTGQQMVLSNHTFFKRGEELIALFTGAGCLK